METESCAPPIQTMICTLAKQFGAPRSVTFFRAPREKAQLARGAGPTDVGQTWSPCRRRFELLNDGTFDDSLVAVAEHVVGPIHGVEA